jgi:ubiquinone/menaquinone biosynthesis C-methylase UbiE
MSALTFDKDAARRLIASYQAPDIVRQRETSLARLKLRPGEHVVDVGCGPGFLCKSMAAAVGAGGRVVGIDQSDDLIAFATAETGGDPIEYRKGDASALPVETGAFDVAVSTQVIEYVADADAVLHEMARTLRPGGRIFICDTDFDSWVWRSSDPARMARIMKGWELHCAHSDLPRTLKPRLEAAGFRAVTVEGYPIINTSYTRDDFGYGLSKLIASFLATRGFERAELDTWLADLAAIAAQGGAFFSLNRYFFSAVKA